ncbi:NAD-dependent epimerase/dehydratase family protein, partial [Acinetobacter baumannii]
GALDDPEKRRLGMRNWLNGEVDFTNLGALASQTGLPSVLFHLAGGSSVGASIAQPYEDFSRTVATSARLLEWLRTNAP